MKRFLLVTLVVLFVSLSVSAYKMEPLGWSGFGWGVALSDVQGWLMESTDFEDYFLRFKAHHDLTDVMITDNLVNLPNCSTEVLLQSPEIKSIALQYRYASEPGFSFVNTTLEQEFMAILSQYSDAVSATDKPYSYYLEGITTEDIYHYKLLGYSALELLSSTIKIKGSGLSIADITGGMRFLLKTNGNNPISVAIFKWRSMINSVRSYGALDVVQVMLGFDATKGKNFVKAGKSGALDWKLSSITYNQTAVSFRSLRRHGEQNFYWAFQWDIVNYGFINGSFEGVWLFKTCGPNDDIYTSLTRSHGEPDIQAGTSEPTKYAFWKGNQISIIWLEDNSNLLNNVVCIGTSKYLKFLLEKIIVTSK